MTTDAFGRCSGCGLKVESTSGVCPNCEAQKYRWPPPSKRPYTCPVCNGSGHVSKPPWVPGDIETWSSDGAGETYACSACEGNGILWGSP